MKRLLSVVWNWLVVSSEDPEKFSARFIGLMTMLSGTLALVLTSAGHPTTNAQIMTVVGQLTQAGGLVYTIFGVVRYLANVIDKRTI